MPVKIHVDIGKLRAELEQTINNGLGIISTEILNDCNQYCKDDTGTLIASSYINSRPNEGKLIWKTPYARRQYYEIQTAYKDNNPNASWKWCEVAKSRHKEEWIRKAQKLLGGR